MAKILLLDFNEGDFRYLLDKKYDVELKETNWKTGKIESLVPPQDCSLVFYQANLNNFGTGLHVGDAENFEKIVADGGAIVCFVGNSQEYHLTNIIGEIPQLKFGENKLPDKIYEIKDKPFNQIFSQFRPFISHAFELFQTHDSLGQKLNLKEWDPPYDGELQILAESYKNYPVSVVLRKGRGFYLLLPWFGEKNVEVAELVLSRILTEISPHLFAENKYNWLDSYEYVFPGLLDIYKEMEEENERHRQNLVRLEGRIEEIKSNDQEPFNKLLITEGAELRQAIIRSFKYLNWINVVDVDEYWKRVIRVKEEDFWLLDENDKSVEQLIRSSQLVQVTVRSGKGGSADEDCLLLQRYKGRRMQEFDNTKMKAVLVGNYFLQSEAKLREVPFTETQISEAAKDGNGLLTTYELFKAIKAEKEKKTTKEALREQLKSKVGLITFDY
jgi:hypothetical protein